jgi:hypothetical protein
MSDIMSLAAIGYPAPLFSSLRDHYAGNLLHTLSISGLSRVHKFSLQDGMMTQEKAVWHAIRAGQRLAG